GEGEAGGGEPRARGVGAADAPREPPEAVALARRRRGAKLGGDLDGDAADTEEEQARAPLGELAVEREPQAERLAEERARGVGIAAAHDGVVERADRPGGIPAPRRDPAPP